MRPRQNWRWPPLGATAAIIGYLQSERVLRPVAVAALRSGVPENVNTPGVILRLMLAWILDPPAYRPGDRAGRNGGQDCLAAPHQRRVPSDGTGRAGHRIPSAPVGGHVDRRPVTPVALGASRVQRGSYNAHADLRRQRTGMLQAGFNDMVRELSERQQLRDLLVATSADVARQALERGTEVGRSERGCREGAVH